MFIQTIVSKKKMYKVDTVQNLSSLCAVKEYIEAFLH